MKAYITRDYRAGARREDRAGCGRVALMACHARPVVGISLNTSRPAKTAQRSGLIANLIAL